MQFGTDYLDQGRFTWHQNNILNYIRKCVVEGLDGKGITHLTKADLDTNLRGGTTVPTECAVTNLKPDICVLLPEDRKIFIIELSVPFEPNISK